MTRASRTPPGGPRPTHPLQREFRVISAMAGRPDRVSHICILIRDETQVNACRRAFAAKYFDGTIFYFSPHVRRSNFNAQDYARVIVDSQAQMVLLGGRIGRFTGIEIARALRQEGYKGYIVAYTGLRSQEIEMGEDFPTVDASIVDLDVGRFINRFFEGAGKV